MDSTRTKQPPFAAAILALLFLLTSYSRTSEKRLSPVDLSTADSIRFQYAVYLLPARSGHSIDPLAAFHDALKKRQDLKEVDEIPKELQGMLVKSRLQKNVEKEYAPPDLKSLQYFGEGISRTEAASLQHSKQALILDFAHPKKNVWTALRAANELLEEIARKTGGLIWDEQTRQVFSPDAWHERRVASWVSEIPKISTETVIHSYNTGHSVRAITLGMSKMGLSDVVIESSGWSSDTQVGNLINLFCQAMAERQPLAKAGEFKLDLHSVKELRLRDEQLKSLKGKAAGVGCFTLRLGRWEEGDPQNRLIQLAFDKYPGEDESAKQEAMVGSFFGSEDSLAKVHHTEELLAASDKAKAKLPELQRAFAAGLEPGEFIDVKVPFKTPEGGNEWMWVEITSWEGGRIKGLLENDPLNVPNLRVGQKVEVRQEDVFDYIRHFADKRTEGNLTGEIIRKMNEGSADAKPDVQIVVPACAAD